MFRVLVPPFGHEHAPRSRFAHSPPDTNPGRHILISCTFLFFPFFWGGRGGSQWDSPFDRSRPVKLAPLSLMATRPHPCEAAKNGRFEAKKRQGEHQTWLVFFVTSLTEKCTSRAWTCGVSCASVPLFGWCCTCWCSGNTGITLLNHATGGVLDSGIPRFIQFLIHFLSHQQVKGRPKGEPLLAILGAGSDSSKRTEQPIWPRAEEEKKSAAFGVASPEKVGHGLPPNQRASNSLP